MLWYILLLLIAVLVLLAAADAFYEIACMKGHEQKKYFWWCFLAPFAGYLMVVALPEQKREVPDEKEVPVEDAAAKVPAVAVYEPAASVKRPKEDEGNIACPVCKRVQRADRSVCWDCGTKLKIEIEHYAPHLWRFLISFFLKFKMVIVSNYELLIYR